MERREDREDWVEERREGGAMGVATRLFFFEPEILIGVEGRGTLAELPVRLADMGVAYFLGEWVAGVFIPTVGVSG